MTVVMPTRIQEEQLWAQGSARVVGIDEVGRGPLAGPVTVAAVILPSDCDLVGVRDSKLLSLKQRERIVREIRAVALGIGVGWVSSAEIDRIGLSQAIQRAALRSLDNLSYDAILLDGLHNYLGDELPVTTAVKADQTCLAVAAASVIAKVARDNYMDLIHQLHPEYGFSTNRGYGSVAHLAALRVHGATSYHRQSFRPVRDLG